MADTTWRFLFGEALYWAQRPKAQTRYDEGTSEFLDRKDELSRIIKEANALIKDGRP